MGHYSWIFQLEDSIVNGTEFKGSLDPTTCGLGKWLQTLVKNHENKTILSAVDALQKPHQYIRGKASEILSLAKTDKAKAYEQFGSDIKPKVENVIGEIATKKGSMQHRQRSFLIV